MNSMTFKEYADQAVTTAKYENYVDAIVCTSLGIMDEYIEYTQELEKSDIDLQAYLDGTYGYTFLKEEEKYNVASELGDCMWKSAVLCNKLNIEPEYTVPVIEEREFFSAVGILQGRAKKILRDYKYSPIPEDYVHIMDEQLSTIYSYFCNECKKLDIAIEKVWKMNLEKLFSRKERNVISGDGSQR